MLKLNQLCINMGASFDKLIKMYTLCFVDGGVHVNTAQLTSLGNEYKVASLICELSNQMEINESTYGTIIRSVYGISSIYTYQFEKLKTQFFTI